MVYNMGNKKEFCRIYFCFDLFLRIYGGCIKFYMRRDLGIVDNLI